MTPEQRKLRARLAAQARWANTPRSERGAATQPARDALAAKWAQSPDPDNARRVHMTRMSLASSRARRSA